jgi:AraC family transcriptional regulator
LYKVASSALEEDVQMRLNRGQFFGSVEDRLTLDNLLITQTSHSGSSRVPRHQHERAYLCIVARGGFQERSEQGSADCDEGVVVWHAAGAAHDDVFGRSETECINIELSDDWLVNEFVGTAALPAWATLATPNAYWIARSIVRESRRTDALATLTLEALTCALLAEICRRDPGTAPAWLQVVLERLRDEFLSPPGIQALARQAGVHRSTLARAFQTQCGQTIGDYVRELRILWACGQLRTRPRTPLSDLALQAGFFDQSHFSRTFRRVMRMTPRAWVRHVHARGQDHPVPGLGRRSSTTGTPSVRPG